MCMKVCVSGVSESIQIRCTLHAHPCPHAQSQYGLWVGSSLEISYETANGHTSGKRSQLAGHALRVHSQSWHALA